MGNKTRANQIGNEVRKQVKQDQNDLYNRWFWYIVLPFLLIYLSFALFNSHQAFPLEDEGEKREGEGENGVLMTIARDSLLKMKVTGEFPDWARNLHAYAGMLLVLGCLIQKQTIFHFNNADWRMAHRVGGYGLILLIGLMALGGYRMGSFSTLENFDFFIVLFAAPWATWFVLLLWSVGKKEYVATHRMLGNMVLKGCVAVPISRLAGAYLQRAGFDEANGYYTGIAGTTVLIGVWEIYEMYLWWTGKG